MKQQRVVISSKPATAADMRWLDKQSISIVGHERLACGTTDLSAWH